MTVSLDKDFLKELGITETDNNKIYEALENELNEVESRLGTAVNEDRIAALEEKKKKIEKQIEIVKESLNSNETSKGQTASIIREIADDEVKAKGSIIKEYNPKNEERDKEKEQVKDKDKESDAAHKAKLKKAVNDLNKKNKSEVKSKSDKNTSDTSNSADSNTTGTNTGATNNGGVAFAQVLNLGASAFKNGNYSEAFRQLDGIASKLDEASCTLSDKDKGTVYRMMGRLYFDGNANNSNDNDNQKFDDSEFWLKKGIKLSSVECMTELAHMYTTKKFNNANERIQNANNALKYFQKAINEGHKESKSKYADVVESSNLGIFKRIKAYIYLMEIANDEENDLIQRNTRRRATAILRGSSAESDGVENWILNILTAIGTLLSVIGVIFMIHGVMGEHNVWYTMNFIDKINPILPINIWKEQLFSVCEYGNVNQLNFGTFLWGIGHLLQGMTDIKYGKNKSQRDQRNELLVYIQSIGTGALTMLNFHLYMYMVIDDDAWILTIGIIVGILVIGLLCTVIGNTIRKRVIK